MPRQVADTESIRSGNRLAELGYEQELVRGLSFWGVLGLAMGVLCLPFTAYAISVICFTEGGAVTFIYGWTIWGLLSLPMVVSLGEICSVFPVAAGTYYWCYALAPQRQKRLGSFINGFILVVGMILSMLATALPISQGVSTAILLYHPDYLIKAWIPYVIFVTLLLCSLFCCALGTVFLERISRFGGIYVFLATAVTFIVPLAKSQSRHSIRWVLTNFESYSGWGNGTSFIIGLLGPAGVLIGFGFLPMMCEEVIHPATTMPRAMLANQVIAIIAGLIYIFGLLFTVPDALSVVSAQLGQSAYVIFGAAMDAPGGALALIIIQFSAAWFTLPGTLAAASRIVWAFARDGGLPGSKWLAVVHPKLKIPFNSMITVCIIDALLGLISLGSSVAYAAFLSSCTIMCILAYCQPILYNIIDRRRQMVGAPWSLGRAGWYLNVASIAICIFGCVVFVLPLYLPVTVVDMNWAIVLLSGFSSIGLVYYAAWGRKVFKAPSLEPVVEDVSPGLEASVDEKAVVDVNVVSVLEA
ncbi:choline transport protein, partial [Tremellales sp. Uapishka_1]